jgi:hypothetical protein
LAEVEGKEKGFDEEAAERFGSEVDICIGNDYEAKGKVNTDIAIFKYDFTYFMSPDELKKLKEKPAKVLPPKAFDFSNAERVVITKEELKQREL